MKMLLKIAWRNIWRNRQRSIVMMIAITVGLWGGLMATGIMLGLIDQRFKTSIEQHISHVQMHHPDFLIDQSVKYYIPDWDIIKKKLQEEEQVKAFSGRTMVNAMLGTANLTTGIQVIGIDPAMETVTTSLDERILEGSYFNQEMRNPMLIGKRLADKVKAKPGSRIVLTFQDIHGELTAANFRVAGIFQTANSVWDEQNIFVMQDDINNYIGYDGQINAISILLDDHLKSFDFANAYNDVYPNLEVRTWAEISPELSYLNEMSSMMMFIILTIILLALAFGLLNTMLMSVFERVKELGMLMAIGMNKKRVFTMIMLETIFLSLCGAAGGMLIAWATIKPLNKVGLNLAAVGGDSLAEFGFEAMVYPQLDTASFFNLTVLVVLCAVLTAIYPARKALKLQPAEAVKE
jgi:putative ABC transport system permease protein